MKITKARGDSITDGLHLPPMSILWYEMDACATTCTFPAPKLSMQRTTLGTTAQTKIPSTIAAI